MPALIPLGCYGFLVLLERRWSSRRDGESGWLHGFLAAAVIWGCLLVLGTEGLSALRFLTPRGVLGFWLLATAAAAFAWLRAFRSGRQALPVRPTFPLGGTERGILIGTAAVVLLVALTAFAAPPNNWDSMTYHLPRVLHWVQDRSVEHYPTHNLRQLTLNPGAEFLLLHVRLLTASDRWWNFVQWLAWGGSAIAASQIAKRLAAGRLGQIAAAVFVTTLPMAVLQASSTQNDLVVSFWLLVFVLFLLRIRERPAGWAEILSAGASLGLALLTKATAYLFALPFLFWGVVVLWRRYRVRALAPLCLLAAPVLLLNLGHWTRNLGLFGSPIGMEHGVINTTVTPAIAVSNVVRNASLHLTMPSVWWNRQIEDSMRAIHRFLGVEVDDVRSTWKGAQFRVPPNIRGAGTPDAEEALYAMLHEDQAGDPLHLALLLLGAGLILGRAALRNRREVRGYLAAVGIGFLLFCLILKWQPWGTRLHLPLFLLGAPLTAVAALGEDNRRRTRMGCAFLLLFSFPWVLSSATRPLLGPANVWQTPRWVQSFANRPYLLAPFSAAGRTVASRGCRCVGLEIGPDDGEYLLWLALKAPDALPPRIEHVSVRNRSWMKSEISPFAGFAPCAVISLSPGNGVSPAGNLLFAQVWSGGRITVRAASH